MTALENFLTGGFLGLGTTAGKPVSDAVKKTIGFAGVVLIVLGGVWIYSKVKK